MIRFPTVWHAAGVAVLSAILTACGTPNEGAATAREDGAGVTIFANANVLTMDADTPRAQALAVRDGLILAVGEREEVEAKFDAQARFRDLEGKTILPGFIDTHGHFAIGSSTATMADLQPSPAGNVDDFEALGAKLDDWYADNAASPWILGFGYDDSLLAENRHPTRDDLDQISDEVPILLIHVSAHFLTCNTPCLVAAGITAETQDPAGGIIRRRAGSQEPDGVLEETAMQLALARLPQPTLDGAMRAMSANQAIYVRNGITTAQEGAGSPAQLAGIEAFAGSGALDIDIVGYQVMRAVADLDDERVVTDRTYSAHFRRGGIKLVLDGSPQGKTAWLTEPYHVVPSGNAEDYAGYATMETKDVNALVAAAFERDIQVIAHANGDAAADQLLTATELANQANGVSDRRPVMIHAQTVRDDQLDKMKASGMIPSFFVAHTFFWGDWHRDSVLGAERAERISPLRSALDRDMVLTIHNDSPVVPPDMMRLIWTAVNRKTRSGDVLGEAERISAMEALEAITIDAAYQYFEEDTKGSIEVGKRADLTILSDDPTGVDPQEIADILVLETIKDGATIYSRE
ncbi:MAG: amidohydrolase [Hyphomonadaceae bacterium]